MVVLSLCESPFNPVDLVKVFTKVKSNMNDLVEDVFVRFSKLLCGVGNHKGITLAFLCLFCLVIYQAYGFLQMSQSRGAKFCF